MWLSGDMPLTGEMGLGRQPMQALFDVAGKHDCSRVEWTTDRDNQAAQDLYAVLGLRQHPSKIFYRVEDATV